MGIQLDPEFMQTIVQKAIFDNITPEHRDQLMVDAIANLMKPSDNVYGDKLPFLVKIFQNAAYEVAREVVKDQFVNNEEFKDKIKKLFAEVAERCFNGEARNKLADNMAMTIVNNMY